MIVLSRLGIELRAGFNILQSLSQQGWKFYEEQFRDPIRSPDNNSDIEGIIVRTNESRWDNFDANIRAEGYRFLDTFEFLSLAFQHPEAVCSQYDITTIVGEWQEDNTIKEIMVDPVHKIIREVRNVRGWTGMCSAAITKGTPHFRIQEKHGKLMIVIN